MTPAIPVIDVAAAEADGRPYVAELAENSAGQ